MSLKHVAILNQKLNDIIVEQNKQESVKEIKTDKKKSKSNKKEE